MLLPKSQSMLIRRQGWSCINLHGAIMMKLVISIMTWNWLVGEYPHNPYAKNVHYTIGGPWFEQYENCDYSFEWVQALRRMINVDDEAETVEHWTGNHMVRWMEHNAQYARR